MVISSGLRIKRLKADKGGQYINKGVKDYCIQTRASLEYASTNTLQQIGILERTGRTLVAKVRCMLVWGELMFMTALVGNRAPHSAIGMQPLYKMLHWTELT